MPTPVSAFSPFTPFTPGLSAHSTSGSYFDRPAASNMGMSSPIGRRPDVRNSGYGSSSFLRMSRVSGTGDSPRQPAENGWKVASRMRDEAWSAWEQQLGDASFSQTDRITLSFDTLVTTRQNNGIRTLEQSQINTSRVVGNDAIKTSSNSPRLPSELLMPKMAPGPFRSISSNGLARPPKLGIKRRSFDPSFFPNHANFHEIDNLRLK